MVRLANVEDAQAIAEVHVATWHAAYRGLIPDATLERLTVEVRRGRWQQNLSKPDSARTTVFERNGNVVGFASVGPSRDEPERGEIWALYAKPDTWGTGVGRALLEEGRGYLESRGWHEVMLWVLDGNARAIRFYEAAGFRLDGGSKDEIGLLHRRMRAG